MQSSTIKRSLIGILAALSLSACSKAPPAPTAPPWTPPDVPSENTLAPVSIVDYGTYHAIITTTGDWSKNQPVAIASVENLVHDQATTSIPAHPDVYWGVRALITNKSDQPLPVLTVIRHPPITTPDGKTSTLDEMGHEIVKPQQQMYSVSLWFFIDRCPYEFVPGTWTWEISVGNKLVATKSFEIHKP